MVAQALMLDKYQRNTEDKENLVFSDHKFGFERTNNPQTFTFSDRDIHSKNLKVWVEEYGCSSSIGDSETIRGLLKGGGYRLGKNEAEGALNIIVTCSVKDTTEHKMLHRIGELMKTGKPLIVAGCLPKANRDLVETKFPLASLLGPQSLNRTIDVVRKTAVGQKIITLEDSNTNKIQLPRVRLNPIIGIIEIASGCVSLCTFCQTKLAKGQLQSHRIGDITRRLKSDVEDGCKEIWLTSTDNGCYGRDIGSDLVDLLESCITIHGDFKIRIGMMNPMFLPALSKKLMKTLSSDNNLFKFLHIPAQSGSDSILRKMKRGHTSKVFVDAVKELRSKIPEITIATDVIVGFPTETDEDFLETIRVVKETEPDIINISKYSARPGTTAAKSKKIGSEIIKQRTKKMHNLANEIGLKRNTNWLKWEGAIIVDSHDTQGLQGRNYAYKPVHIGRYENKTVTLGDKINVRIEGVTSHILTGSIVSTS